MDNFWVYVVLILICVALVYFFFIKNSDKKKPKIKPKCMEKVFFSSEVLWKSKKLTLEITRTEISLLTKKRLELVHIEPKLIYAVNVIGDKDKSCGVQICSISSFKSDALFVSYDVTLTFPSASECEKKSGELISILQQLAFLRDYSPNSPFRPLQKSERRVLILCNPVSGNKIGKKVLEKKIKPIFDQSHLQYEAVVLEKPFHAKEICQKIDPKKFTEICVLGGDGTFHEVVNGLLTHESISYKQMGKIPISLIPLGTGNGIAMDIGCGLNVNLGIFVAAKGNYIKMDVMSMYQKGKLYFSSLGYCFGIPSDTDCIGQLYFRWLGPIRDVLLAFCLGARRKYYKANLKMVKDKGQMDDPFDKPKEYSTLNVYEVREHVNANVKVESLENPLIKEYFMKEMESIAPKFVNEVKNSKKYKRETIIEEDKRSTFLLIILGVRRLSHDFWGPAFAMMNNGFFDVLRISKKTNLVSHIWTFFKFLMDTPSHMKAKIVSVDRLRAFYFEPKEGRYATVDGEMLIDGGSVIGEVHEKMLTLMILNK